MPILGTSPDAIDLAEDRDRFQQLLDKLGLKQPKNGIAYSVEQARLVAGRSRLPAGGAPVLRARRPRHGRSSTTRRSSTTTCSAPLPSLVPADVKARYPNDKTGQINTVLGKNPLLFDRYLSDAIEVDVDCLADGKDTFVAGIMEHIEEAGIHSGDSACSLPPHSLTPETIAELERQTRDAGARARRRRPDERAVRHQGRRRSTCSRSTRAPRAPCRSSPRSSACRSPRSPRASWPASRSRASSSKPQQLDHVAVKEAVFPFARFPGVDTLLGPGDALDRRGHGPRPRLRASPSPRASSAPAPRCRRAGTVFVSVRDDDKAGIARAVQRAASSSASRCIATARHPALPRRARRRRRQDQQGAGRPAAHRRRHQERRGAAGLQHHRGRAGAGRLAVAAPRRPLA